MSAKRPKYSIGQGDALKHSTNPHEPSSRRPILHQQNTAFGGTGSAPCTFIFLCSPRESIHLHVASLSPVTLLPSQNRFAGVSRDENEVCRFKKDILVLAIVALPMSSLNVGYGSITTFSASPKGSSGTIGAPHCSLGTRREKESRIPMWRRRQLQHGVFANLSTPAKSIQPQQSQPQLVNFHLWKNLIPH